MTGRQCHDDKGLSSINALIGHIMIFYRFILTFRRPACGTKVTARLDCLELCFEFSNLGRISWVVCFLGRVFSLGWLSSSALVGFTKTTLFSIAIEYWSFFSRRLPGPVSKSHLHWRPSSILACLIIFYMVCLMVMGSKKCAVDDAE